MRTSICVVFLALSLFLSQASIAQKIDEVADDLANQIASSLKSGGKNKIAVLGFTDLSSRSIPLGRLISDELTNKLFAKGEGKFQIVERSRIEEVFNEQKLGLSGVLEEKRVQMAGQIAGVDALLTGTIATFEHQLRINARLIGVPSAKLFSIASAYMDRSGVTDDLLRPDPSSPQGKGSVKKQNVGPIARKEFKDISVELLECTHTAGLITCKLILTNNGDDSSITIGHNSHEDIIYIYDQRGYIFRASEVKIGDKRGDTWGVDKLLITGIPMSLQIFFEEIPPAVESIKILSIRTSIGNIEFRDVPLTKE